MLSIGVRTCCDRGSTACRTWMVSHDGPVEAGGATRLVADSYQLPDRRLSAVAPSPKPPPALSLDHRTLDSRWHRAAQKLQPAPCPRRCEPSAACLGRARRPPSMSTPSRGLPLSHPCIAGLLVLGIRPQTPPPSSTRARERTRRTPPRRAPFPRLLNRPVLLPPPARPASADASEALRLEGHVARRDGDAGRRAARRGRRRRLGGDLVLGGDRGEARRPPQL